MCWDIYLYKKKTILYSRSQDLKFTCSEDELLWLDISLETISNSSKNILVWLFYRNPIKSIKQFSKKVSYFFVEKTNSYKYTFF